MDLEHIPFSIHECVRAVVDLFHPRAAEKDLELRLNLPPDDLLPMGDPFRLRQILINLMSNAVKFTSTGSITLSAQWTPHGDGHHGELRFDVIDTGIGIPADTVDQLFEKFTQADTSTTRRYGGTGLGLAISRELTHLMGGTLRVQSVVNQGSTFTLVLPTRLHSGEISPSSVMPPAAIEEIETTPATSSPKGSILLVEDNATNRKLATIMLERLGYTVNIAVNGNEALEMVARHTYQAVLMDCEMPELDGFEATRLIREREKANPDQPRLPVIALTANVMEGVEARCREAGMDVYLTKPIQLGKLKATLTPLIAT